MVVEMDDALDGRMATRANLAGYHLQAAVSFARHAHDIESQNRDRPFDDAFLPIFWSASSSVIMSATALEACINEMIKDAIRLESPPPQARAPHRDARFLLTGLARDIICRCQKSPRPQKRTLNHIPLGQHH